MTMALHRERLLRKVVMADGGCWVRTGANVSGYPVVKVKGRQHRAARLSYEVFVGPIPEGLEIDHLCRNVRCVHPGHLEPVTSLVNNRRRAAQITHCPRGHEYAEHAYLFRGHRLCKPCRAAYQRIYKARRRAQN